MSMTLSAGVYHHVDTPAVLGSRCIAGHIHGSSTETLHPISWGTFTHSSRWDSPEDGEFIISHRHACLHAPTVAGGFEDVSRTGKNHPQLPFQRKKTSAGDFEKSSSNVSCFAFVGGRQWPLCMLCASRGKENTVSDENRANWMGVGVLYTLS